jgi:KaiC/GvpD/RAD55 family RecA-like ATPase
MRLSYTQRLPIEIREFLGLPGPQSLLVRGPPGSGKTTLCLAMLEAAAGARILVTSRVSQGELNRGFPWLGENGGSSIQIVDTTVLEANVRETARAAAAQSAVIDGGGRESREFSEFLWLPPPVQEAWSRLSPDAPSIVVIDSWDALVEQYMGGAGPRSENLPDRAEVERILLRLLGKSRAHVVIVLERREESQLDYLVNGVVVTERMMGNDRLERWLHLPKLRGIRIANGYYPYTVEGAKFQCIEPIRAYADLRKGRFDSEPDAMPGHLWPGSRTFAESFGRLPVGKTTLFETDGEVQDQIIQIFLGPMIASVANDGGRALLIPSPSLSAKEIWESVKGTASLARLEQGLRVVDVTGQLGGVARQTAPELTKMIAPLKALLPSSPPTPGSMEPPETDLRRFLSTGGVSGAPVLAATYVSGFVSLAGALRMPLTADQVETFPAMVQSSLGSAPMHSVLAGRTGAPLFEAVRSLAAIHIHLRVRQGRVFVYGSKPWTSGFVLAEGTDTVPYDLLRIV